jgi:CelD/BcsL family acetyltransferase involved in cellulose biosynthesis
MRIENIRSADPWAALAEEWNALLQESHNNVPFLTYEFQRAWWDGLGGGEWPTAELNILIARDDNGKLLGIAPFFSSNRDGKDTLYLIGSHEIADFLDFIVRPADHAAFSQAVTEYLASPEAPAWQSLELYNLLDQSATLQVLPALAQERNWSVTEDVLQASPYITIPATFEEYVDSLDSKQAHELRRKLRRAAREAARITLEIVSDPADLDQALLDFFGLMGTEEDKAGFLKPSMRAQMDAIARAAFKGGWLQLGFLKAGNQRVAAYLNFDYNNRIWAYNAGFDPVFANLSPGWLILAELIRWSAENQRAVFDFMRGDEEYKYRFGGVNRYVKKLTITKP